MKIAYLIPPTSYDFFRALVPYLQAAGHAVEVNEGVESADLVLAAMLPQTAEWGPAVEAHAERTIVWHWDQFSFVDYTAGGWPSLYRAMPRALDIWSASYETARQLKQSHGYESFVVGSFVVPSDFGEPPFPTGSYVLYVTSPKAFHKRLAWVELACRRLGLPLRSTYQDETRLARADYCRLVRGCRCYVMAACEESNGTIPTLEAAVCGKPIVLSDLPACREEFGDAATYFSTWDFGDLVRQLAAVYAGKHPSTDAARQRVLRLFSIERVAARIVRRIRELAGRQVPGSEFQVPG